MIPVRRMNTNGCILARNSKEGKKRSTLCRTDIQKKSERKEDGVKEKKRDRYLGGYLYTGIYIYGKPHEANHELWYCFGWFLESTRSVRWIKHEIFKCAYYLLALSRKPTVGAQLWKNHNNKIIGDTFISSFPTFFTSIWLPDYFIKDI